jgi:hypothetical protein
MRHLLKYFIIFGLTFSAAAHAVVCPWVHKTGNDLLNPGRPSDEVVNLSQIQVQEDLSCLKIVLSQYYAYHITYPSNEIVSRLEKAMSNAKPLSNIEFLDQIFSFHNGYTDLHMSYQTAGVQKRFEIQNPIAVKLSEDLNAEQIYERSEYTYFKPGKLLPELTAGQSAFIEYLTKNDRPLVIDLRGNRGGDNAFAFSLVDVLFAKEQHVPGSAVTQVAGGLPYVGLVVTASYHYGDAVKDFRNQITQLFGSLPFDQLLSKKLDVENRNFVGKRPARYTAPIFLITDSQCTSACETIVEKISAHPNVKTIGAHTGGALHFGNAMSFILPNSGILIAVPSRAETYENQAGEGIGYVPNIEASYVDLNALFEKH